MMINRQMLFLLMLIPSVHFFSQENNDLKFELKSTNDIGIRYVKDNAEIIISKTYSLQSLSAIKGSDNYSPEYVNDIRRLDSVILEMKNKIKNNSTISLAYSKIEEGKPIHYSDGYMIELLSANQIIYDQIILKAVGEKEFGVIFNNETIDSALRVVPIPRYNHYEISYGMYNTESYTDTNHLSDGMLNYYDLDNNFLFKMSL